MATKKNAQTVNAAGEKITDVRSPKEITWEKYTTFPLILLSFVFILGYSILILSDDVYTQPLYIVIVNILIFIWVCFIVDYFTRLALAAHKKIFFKRNIIDLLSIIVPFTRPFLLLMYLSRLKFFKGQKGTSVRARLIAYAGFFAVMFVYVLSLAEYAAERNAPNATIVNYGDSVWWAIVTITTVGYGDMYPVTPMGRFFAIILMLGGVIIVGAATGTFVSFLGEKVQSAHKKAVEEDGE